MSKKIGIQKASFRPVLGKFKKWSKMVEYGQKWLNMVKNGQHGQKLSNMVKMVKNGQKCTKMV